MVTFLPGSRWVPTRHLSRIEWFGLVVAGIVLGIGGLGVRTLELMSRPPLTLAQIGGLTATYITVASLLALIPWLRTPRNVGLSSAGITIVYPFRHVAYPWNELMTMLGVDYGIVSFRPLSYNPKKQVGMDWLTLEQARAIVTDPRCPQVRMTDDQRRRIMAG